MAMFCTERSKPYDTWFWKQSVFGFTFPMTHIPSSRFDSSAKRGSYVKGLAKREEILTRALDVIAREGYRGASVKEMADAVGLSQAGLLHYFDSKEELFTEILRKRDERDSTDAGLGKADSLQSDRFLRDSYVAVARHNAAVPGLVELFARLSVDAADPEHPAHDFFLERGTTLRAFFAQEITKLQAAGRITDWVAPETLARILQAVADGMQVQWMLEPDVDMAATIEALFTALTPPTPNGR